MIILLLKCDLSVVFPAAHIHAMRKYNIVAKACAIYFSGE